MGFSCGIVGLPNVGKSTLFNVLTENAIPAENFPFCTIDPNVAKVPVPDERLGFLSQVHKSLKITPTTLEFVDIAGLVKGASKGEGLGNQFLSTIRTVDAVCHIVRCFKNDTVTHVDGAVDPKRDYTTIMTELALSDLELLQRKFERVSKNAKSGDKALLEELSLLEVTLKHLSEKQTLPATDDPKHVAYYNNLGLLLSKPMLVVCNGSEDTDKDMLSPFMAFLKTQNVPYLIIDIALEIEAKALDPQERHQILSEMGYDKDALNRFIVAGYQILHLNTFFTSGPKETRAWTIPQGTTASEAAGKIHSDMQRGFIRAETYHVDDLRTHGSEKALREHGKIRQEGKDYIVKDGDVLYFRFNV